MTTARQESASHHPLLRGASAEIVSGWLLPEDQARFAEELDAAATDQFAEVVERWRQLAVLQSDPAAFRRTVRRLAQVATGVEPSPDEPLHVTRATAGI